MGRWWSGVAGWSSDACPIVVGSGLYGIPAGISGGLLYALGGPSSVDLFDFPAITLASTVDLDPAMDALGASGAGNIRAITLDDTGHLYTVGYITNSDDLQVMKVLLDGTSPTLLVTFDAGFGSSGLSPAIAWHPADPSYIYVLHADDSGGSELKKVHRSTGTIAMAEPLASFTDFGNAEMQQYDGGFVFFVGTAGFPTTGDIWVYDIGADAFASIDAADSFGGMGTSPAGLTYWTEDSVGAGGTGAVHAFEVTAGPTITEVSPGCADPWAGSEVIYWFATPDRSEVYVGDGVNVWQWP